jgi:hypothetical protein
MKHMKKVIGKVACGLRVTLCPMLDTDGYCWRYGEDTKEEKRLPQCKADKFMAWVGIDE